MKAKSLFLVVLVLCSSLFIKAQCPITINGETHFKPSLTGSYAKIYYSSSYGWELRSSTDYTGYIGYYGGLYALEARYVYATNVPSTSDERLKKNIQTLFNALPVIKKLKPVTFDYNFDYSNVTNEKLKSKLQSDDKDRLGFIAQDVQKILPQSVKVNESDSMLGIQMNDFIPILVKGMQEQTMKIDSLKMILEDLKIAQNFNKNATIPLIGNEISQVAVLYQNNPNPFKENTLIRCIVPSNITEAKMLIFDMQGSLIKTYLITARDKTSVTISGAELNSGMYIYTLVTDGKEVDSKRMILTN